MAQQGQFVLLAREVAPRVGDLPGKVEGHRRLRNEVVQQEQFELAQPPRFCQIDIKGAERLARHEQRQAGCGGCPGRPAVGMDVEVRLIV